MIASRVSVRQGASCIALPARRASVKASAFKQVQSAGILAASVLAVAPAALADEVAAPAVDVVNVDSAIETISAAIKSAGEVAKAGVSVVEAGIKIAQEAYVVAAPIIKQGVDAVTPLVNQALDLAGPAVKSALPAIQASTKDLPKVLESTGVDFKIFGDVSKTAGEATSAATPYINKAYAFTTSTEPILLGEYAIGAFAIYLLAPTLLGAFAGTFRGYAGELSAIAALDMLSNDASALLVDVRTIAEKEQSGMADVPSAVSGKVVEVEYAVTEDRKLRGQLRDPSAIEAQVTALQIASLKRAGSGNTIILMCRYGSQAGNVAKELSKKGFSKVYIVQGGFDGGSGWVKSKLQIKPVSSSSGGFGTISSRSGRKALPAPRF
jgi:rhodanese-related sulfurtransferase